MNTKKIQMQQGHYRGDTGVGATHPAGLPLTLVAPTPVFVAHPSRIQPGSTPAVETIWRRSQADQRSIGSLSMTDARPESKGGGNE